MMKDKLKSISSIALKMVGEKDILSLSIGSRWKEIVGPIISKNSSPKLMKNGTLKIYVTSSSWIHHVNSLKHDIMRSVKSKIGLELKRVFILNSVKNCNYDPSLDFYNYRDANKSKLSEEEKIKVDSVFNKIEDLSIKDGLSKLVKRSLERNDFKNRFHSS